MLHEKSILPLENKLIWAWEYSTYTILPNELSHTTRITHLYFLNASIEPL